MKKATESRTMPMATCMSPGYTSSTNFPINNPYQTNNAGGKDAFVTKMNNSGSLLVYSTYLGGGDDDVGNGIAVDKTGNVYVTGSTASTNYPTISPTILPVQSVHGGVVGTTDAFVTKFNVFGSQLIFSTYLGGSMNDVGKRVRVDSRNAIYVTGSTILTNNAIPSQNNFPIAPQANTLQSGHSGLQGPASSRNSTRREHRWFIRRSLVPTRIGSRPITGTFKSRIWPA